MITSTLPCSQLCSFYEFIMFDFSRQSFYSTDSYLNPIRKPNVTCRLSSVCMLMCWVSFMVVVIWPGIMIVMMLILDLFLVCQCWVHFHPQYLSLMLFKTFLYPLDCLHPMDLPFPFCPWLTSMYPILTRLNLIVKFLWFWN